MEIRPPCALGDLAGAQMQYDAEETQHQHKAVQGDSLAPSWLQSLVQRFLSGEPSIFAQERPSQCQDSDSTSVKRPMKIHSAYLLQMLCSSRRKPDSRLSLPWPPSRPPAASWPRTSTTGTELRIQRFFQLLLLFGCCEYHRPGQSIAWVTRVN
ncbi:pancreatic progenitor cell differentiation and proliferation factor-like protein isoform X3 [Onychostruthus taczanowskii]|uniref:pancreatic progenitor cell differentiation and proliferation factor-like protein isoform X3 n=1 Tax=Onychostruthus taczanowskii TaxID=356909 RepID=UPI001B802F30|nr:pancreatic progenitor cell differentiation and proliferation factor-like protein isoform X3 [Onychostruthus taczanowskii]